MGRGVCTSCGDRRVWHGGGPLSQFTAAPPTCERENTRTCPCPFGLLGEEDMESHPD